MRKFAKFTDPISNLVFCFDGTNIVQIVSFECSYDFHMFFQEPYASRLEWRYLFSKAIPETFTRLS
jgi:hypothetical protein